MNQIANTKHYAIRDTPEFPATSPRCPSSMNLDQFATVSAAGVLQEKQAPKYWIFFLPSIIAISLLFPGASRAQDSFPLDTLIQRIREYYDNGDHAGALPLAKEYVGKAKDRFGVQSEPHAIALTTLGEGLIWAGNTPEAENVLLQAKKILEETNNNSGDSIVTVYSYLGLSAKYQGRFTQAETYYEKAINSGSQLHGKMYTEVADDINNLAELYREMGLLEKSERLHQDALHIREKTEGAESLKVAESLNNIGLLYQNGWRLEEAKDYLLRSSDIRKKILPPGHQKLATLFNNISLVYKRLHDFPNALAFAEDALKTWRLTLPADHPRVGTGLINLSDVHREIKLYGESEKEALEAISIFERKFGREHPTVAAALSVVAQIEEDREFLERALAYYETSLGIWTSLVTVDHPRMSEAYYNIARISYGLGDWRTALINIQKSVDGTVKGTRHETVSNDNESARTYADVRFLDHAIISYWVAKLDPRRERELKKESFRQAQWPTSTAASASVLQMATRIAAGDAEVSDQVRLRQNLVLEWRAHDRALIAAMSKPQQERSLASEEEHRTKLSQIDDKIADIDGMLRVAFPKYAALAAPESLSIEEVQAQLSADEVLVLILSGRSRLKPAPAETFLWVVTKADAQWVRSNLNMGTLTREVEALRCGLDSGIWFSNPPAVTKIQKCLKILGLSTAPVKGEPLPFDLQRSHELYRALFGEIEDQIKDKKLIIVPSGPLTTLPFSVLVTVAPDPELTGPQAYRRAAWLGVRQPITVLPSVASLQALRKYAKASGAPKQFIGIGNPLLMGPMGSSNSAFSKQHCPALALPTAPMQLAEAAEPVINRDSLFRGPLADVKAVGRLRPLPETTAELCSVARGLGIQEGEIESNIWLGERATETNIKDLSRKGELSKYGILHFATHGLIAGDIKGLAEPALVLTPPKVATETDDGLLTASEIAELKLNADWVVLSACNTAAGDGQNAEALSGLARAFFYAGARALLVSHWPVNSNTAVKLTTRAFAALKSNPALGRAESLQLAIAETIFKGSDKEVYPSRWAPFILVGEGAR